MATDPATLNAHWRALVVRGLRVEERGQVLAQVDAQWTRSEHEAPLELPQGAAVPAGYELVGRRRVRVLLGRDGDGRWVAEQRVRRIYEIEAGGPLRDPRLVRPRSR
jgi:hypothetical protein